jgi:ribose transport system substrate-binding protein
VTAAHPSFKVVGVGQTDFTATQGNTKTANLIQAHPTATILFSPLSDVTEGAVAALRAAGKTGVRVYDVGGNSWDFTALRSGEIAASARERPATAAQAIVKAFVDARAGKAVPAVILNDGAPPPAGATSSGFVTITKQNMSNFAPQF